ncbi:immunity 52 family protein [Xanthomonas sp. AmX2]|uniref:Imm52 family immunity protein n=1 Tax=Xanthomonas sp. TaxID=29446 RepID=UPI00197FA0BC|nr:Imm52 family immunity protein [Xanthomonas sp.]MBN6149345.1 immunity 52 family protein [Xanthomonas sp.]
MKLTAEQAYEEAAGWVERLASTHEDFCDWWAVPAGPKDPFVSFSDRQAIVSRIQADDQMDQEFPGAPSQGSNGVLLTNAGSEKEWAKRGKVSLSITPSAGDVRLGVSGIEKLYSPPVDVVWALLKALVSDTRTRFAQTNIKQRVINELLLYSVDRAPFPHREFLGWMGYVPQALTTEQVPNAAKLERQGKGTLILSTPLLDLSDPAAIEQANQVEMSLVDLDLLPVTDPYLS